MKLREANTPLLHYSAAAVSRRPSYQKSQLFRFRAAAGPRKIIQSDRDRIFVPEYIRSLRPEVRIGTGKSLNRPIFFNAMLK